jgi:hypothetical protein
MVLLKNIRPRDKAYREVKSLLYYALPRDLQKASREVRGLLDVATDLFFIFYSVAPSLSDESFGDSVVEGARIAFTKLWAKFMELRAMYGTVLDFNKSFAIALKFLIELLRGSSVTNAYASSTNAMNIEYILTQYVLTEPSSTAYSAKQGVGSGASYSVWASKEDTGPFQFGVNIYIPEDVVYSMVRGMMDAIYEAGGSVSTKRLSSVVIGVTRGNNMLRAKPAEYADDDLMLIKYANSELAMREYGELELNLVPIVDFSSSTMTSMVTLDIRLITQSLYTLANMLRTRHIYVFFKDNYIVLGPDQAPHFIKHVMADGGTNIDVAVYAGDRIAENLSEDTRLVLVSDCEDSVRYIPEHRITSVVVVNDKLSMDGMTRNCINHYARLGRQVILTRNEAYKDPYRVGMLIGNALVS